MQHLLRGFIRGRLICLIIQIKKKERIAINFNNIELIKFNKPTCQTPLKKSRRSPPLSSLSINYSFKWGRQTISGVIKELMLHRKGTFLF